MRINILENFSDELKIAAAPIWEKIFKHPFLVAIKNGSLPIETFRYYLTQDYLYLEGFARTGAMALAKAPDSETLEELSHRVLTPVERPLHHKLLAEAEVTLTSIYEAGPSPTNTAYVNHMIKTASLYGLGPTAAALLPCPWTYHLLKDEVGASDHPLYSQWTEFYVAGFLENSVAAWRKFVDQAALTAGPGELNDMRRAFITSSQYEYMFWEAALSRESWPINVR